MGDEDHPVSKPGLLLGAGGTETHDGKGRVQLPVLTVWSV
jgi:hypothetical protein